MYRAGKGLLGEIIRSLVSTELVFINNDGSYVDNRQINYLLEKYARHNGLVAKRSHSLRRTYATLLYLGGVEKPLIQAYLGHSDISTTERYICAQRDASQAADLIVRAI